MTYIALLRGINVAGHNKIKMADLKLLFLELGFSDIQTYIQSGNVVFKHLKMNISNIERTITKSIYNKYGFTTSVLVVTKAEFKTIFNNNPFLEKANIDISKLHVTLLKSIPNSANLASIRSLEINRDEFIINEKSVYLYCPNGYGKTKLNTNLFEKKLNTSATTRNWKTISKLIELSS